MNRWTRMAAAALLLATGSAHGGQAGAGGTPLTVGPQGFQLRGKPFRIVSGELEYARIPRELWRDRLRKARAMGLNAITVYVFWNLHEPRPGIYDFSGQNDVAEFLREAQQEGLYVVLRPGPYVCAEWDLGGFPAWLLKDPPVVLRSLDPRYMQAATRWMHRLGQELAPLQADRGGPILALQVENEYGSFVPKAGQESPAGEGLPYLEAMYRLVQASGFTGSLLYTADGAEELEGGSLPGVFAGIDFGTGEADHALALLHQKRPGLPVYVAEYWDGWFDHWGAPHQVTDGAKQVAEVKHMLAGGDSVSLYMVHGGTSWGWMNGANWDSGKYEPDVSSYDYDAPLDESGRPRPKYFALRQAIAEATGVQPPPVPETPPTIQLPEVALGESVSLWSALPAPAEAPQPQSMEDLDQPYGWADYRAQVRLTGPTPAELRLGSVHSYAQVYLDGALVGTVDRRLGAAAPPTLAGTPGPHRLDVLVENTARINFSRELRGEWAGLRGPVLLGGQPVGPWKMFSLPLNQLPATGWHKAACEGPCLYRGSLQVTEPGDTYLDVSKLGKGSVWVNGHNLGRFWEIGPMGTLYLPGVWLHKGANEVVVLDLRGGEGSTLRGVREPVYLPAR